MNAKSVLEVSVGSCAVGVAIAWLFGEFEGLILAGLLAMAGVLLTVILVLKYRNLWWLLTLFIFAWPAFGVTMLMYQCGRGNFM